MVASWDRSSQVVAHHRQGCDWRRQWQFESNLNSGPDWGLEGPNTRDSVCTKLVQ